MTTMPEGDVTFLMLDVQGSTGLLARIGADECARVFGELHELARGVARECRGVVFKTEGDGAWLAFAEPEQAMVAGVGVTEAIAGHSWGLDVRPRARVALHRGEAVLRDGEYVAMAIHQLARVGHAGHGDQVICTPSVLDGVAGAPVPAARLLGAYWVRDFPEPVPLYQVDTAVSGEFPALDLPRADLTNLTKTDPGLIGREELLDDVESGLRSARLVTLLGPGGAGKTTIAVAAGRRLVARGATFWLVNLAPVEAGPDATMAAWGALASSLGVEIAEPDAVLTRLASRATTLLVDNCEHVRDAATDVVEEVLGRCPDVKVLATTREALRLVGEVVLEVGGLPAPGAGASFEEGSGAAAVQLFETRARQASTSFRVTPANWSHVAQLCRELDGLPLAIELAASSARTRTPKEVLDELHLRGSLPSSQTGRFDRHRDLESVVRWSLASCSAEEERVFRCLAVFGGPVADEAVAAVAGLAADEARAVLTGLIEKNLVVATSDEDDVRRHHLLATMTLVARAQLEASGERGRVEAAHARWIARAWRDAFEAGTLGTGGVLLAELRQAMDRTTRLPTAEAVALVDLPLSSFGFRSTPAARAALDDLVGRADLDGLGRAAVRVLQIHTPANYGEEQPPALLEDTIAAARAAASPYHLVLALCGAALGGADFVENSGDAMPRERSALLREAKSLVDSLSGAQQAYAAAFVHNCIGIERASVGDHGGALESHRRALALAVARGDVFNTAIDHGNIADLYAKKGDLVSAVSHLKTAVDLVRERGKPATVAMWAEEIARHLEALGDLAGAAEWASHAALAARRSGQVAVQSRVVAHQALLATKTGNLALAKALAAEVLRLEPEGQHAAAMVEIIAS